MKKMIMLSLVTATVLTTVCSAEEKGLLDILHTTISDMKKVVNEKSEETTKSTSEEVVSKSTEVVNVVSETTDKNETESTKSAPEATESKGEATEQKLDSIGEKKTIGEIITIAGGATVEAEKKAETVSSTEKKVAEENATTEKKVEESNATSEEKTEAVATDAFDYKLEPKKVAENVWCFFGAIEKPTKENAGNMANNCYIKTNDGYLVMDTGPSYQFAKQAYEAMQKIEDLPVKYVVNSHEHDDHWLGNDFYKQKFGTTLIGPESINTNYKEGDKTRMYNVLPPNAIEGTHIIDLDKVVKEKETLTLGGEKFDIIPMDVRAHTGDDVFIYMPERKVLFAGDLVMNGRITSGRHGSVMGQLKALAMMQKLDWKVLVPGHGFITDATAMDEADLYFKLTKERVLKAIDEGVDATEINEVVKLIEFKDKAMYDILNAQNIGFAFDELEMLDEDEDEE